MTEANLRRKHAAIVESDEHGQILVQHVEGDDGEMVVRVTWDPGIDGIGLASFDVGFTGADVEARAAEAFEKLAAGGPHLDWQIRGIQAEILE